MLGNYLLYSLICDTRDRGYIRFRVAVIIQSDDEPVSFGYEFSMRVPEFRDIVS